MSQMWCQNCIHCQEGSNPKYPHCHYYCDLTGWDEVWEKSHQNNNQGRQFASLLRKYENLFYIDDGYLYFCAEIEYDLPYRIDDSEDNRPCFLLFRGALYGEDYDGFEAKY